MARAPTYESRVAAPGAPALAIRPVALPNLPTSGIGAAIAGAGGAAIEFAATLDQAQRATRRARATSSYLESLQALEDRYARDPDYQTAAARFDAEANELTGRMIAEANLAEPDAAELQLSFDRMRISSRGGVKAKALAREASDNVAALDGMELSLSRLTAASGSATERAAYQNEFRASVDTAIANGWITAEAGENYLQRFLGNVDEADVLRMIRENPRAAATVLADPAAFGALGPVQRERYRNNAESEADQAAIDSLAMMAETRPEAAAVTLNRVLDAATAEAIFDRAVIPTESGGRADAVSNKNAIGVSQVLLGTAREMAPSVGRADLLDLSDADLKKTLIADPSLNRALGLAYWKKQLRDFDGNIALAAAAYNAGPGKAREWQAKAREKFGENFSASELVTVVSYGETRDYIDKIFAAAGGKLEGAGLSPRGYARAWSAVSTALAASERSRVAAIRDMASAMRDAEDPLDLIKGGYKVDTGQLADYLATQRQAAATGDDGAAKELRRAETMMAVKPLIDAFYQQSAAETETMLAALETALVENPSPALLQRVEVLREVADEIARTRNDNPIALVERAIPSSAVAVDPSAPIDRNFEAALGARGRQAEIAAERFGGRALPFKPAEAAALAERWSAAGEGDRFQILSAMAQNLPERVRREAIGQMKLDGGAKLAATFAATRPDIARRILRGKALLQVEGVQKAAADLSPALARTIDGDLYPDPAALADVVDAALAVYVADRGGAGAMFDATDTAALKAAIEDVAGEFTTRGGMRVAAPPGMSASDFDRAIDDIGERLSAAGGARDRAGDVIGADDIAWSGVFRQLAPGSTRYVVGFRDPASSDGFAPLFTQRADKRGMTGPLVIDFAPPKPSASWRDDGRLAP